LKVKCNTEKCPFNGVCSEEIEIDNIKRRGGWFHCSLNENILIRIRWDGKRIRKISFRNIAPRVNKDRSVFVPIGD
jgi:hypothetical protein